jgi:hypothetical protein
MAKVEDIKETEVFLRNMKTLQFVVWFLYCYNRFIRKD